MDDLLGKLLTHEIHLKVDEEEAQRKREVAFKTTIKELHSFKESSQSDEDFMANIARGLKMMFKSKRFDPKKFYKKGSSSKRHEKKNQKVSKPLTIKMKLILILVLDVLCQGM